MASTQPSAPKPWPALAAAAGFVALLVLYPPFHVVRAQPAPAAASAVAPAAFSAPAFAAEFWSAQLQPAATRAPALGPILAALRRDPAAAAKQHGRQAGLGGAATFFARGSGRIVAVERSRVLVQVDDAVVAVRTGPIFGNLVRDGCGLLEVNQSPGLAEFNALSAELNRLVEERVLPGLRAGAAVGATLTFAGCTEAPETLPAAGAPLLTFVPVDAGVTP